MKELITQRIAALRDFLAKNNLAAFIIPSTDPHLSEYVASHWKARKWISGFTGSAGTIVITSDKAGLWTDSRYFLQAAQQLEGTEIELYKEGLPYTLPIPEWLCTVLKKGDKVGIDGKMFSINEVKKIRKILNENSINLDTTYDPMEKIWEDRPPIPPYPAFLYPIEYAGVNCANKISQIRKELQKKQINGILISALDEIAWTLNLRGNDVKCNPVVISYLLITQQETILFILPQKLTPEITKYLESQKIKIKNYEEVYDILASYKEDSLLIVPEKTNEAIFEAINSNCRILFDISPVSLLKAIRNEQEIKGIHAAMQRDGIALVKFLHWLEKVVPTGKETELSIDKKLHDFRSQQELYKGESFDTIAGYKEHGAIVHYSATPDTDAILQSKSFLLLDSGAQYLDGTTDITRTIALGELTEEEKKDYTLILKGHIALAMAKFPAGTRGAQLDVLARMPIWQQGMNFLHGTGHGVGHFLSVHEGPQSIRMNENPIPLLPGMLVSNEPGVYKTDSHGIRIENLLLVCKDKEGMFGEYYKFETVTLCPICKKGIIKEMLTSEEIEWLNEYHQKVYEKLSPNLNEEERIWLKVKTDKL